MVELLPYVLLVAVPVEGRYVPDSEREEDVPVLRLTAPVFERPFDKYLSGPPPFPERVTEEEAAETVLERETDSVVPSLTAIERIFLERI